MSGKQMVLAETAYKMALKNPEGKGLIVSACGCHIVYLHRDVQSSEACLKLFQQILAQHVCPTGTVKSLKE